MGIIHSVILLFVFTAFVLNIHTSQIPNYDSSYDDFQQEEEAMESGYGDNDSESYEIPEEYHENEQHSQTSEVPL